MKGMTPEEINRIINSSQVSRFTRLDLARGFIECSKKPQHILHGDDGRFWVAGTRVASILERAGYEVIE